MQGRLRLYPQHFLSIHSWSALNLRDNALAQEFLLTIRLSLILLTRLQIPGRVPVLGRPIPVAKHPGDHRSVPGAINITLLENLSRLCARIGSAQSVENTQDRTPLAFHPDGPAFKESPENPSWHAACLMAGDGFG